MKEIPKYYRIQNPIYENKILTKIAKQVGIDRQTLFRSKIMLNYWNIFLEWDC